MSLQQWLDTFQTPLDALTPPVRPANIFPYPLEHTNWREEQRAWVHTAALFDQSWHMNDLFISGPDAIRLLSETSANGYQNFRSGRAKQYLAIAADGHVIGDAIVFGLTDDLFKVVNGAPAAINWLRYQAETGDYDVTMELDPARVFAGEGSTPKRLYRYELEGPNAQRILEAAVGTEFEPIRFFRMGELEIADHRVQVLSHTMAAVPGAENTGLELFGPVEHADAFLEAILDAGKNFGLVRAGAIAYGTTTVESGWMALPVPAIYTSEDMRPFREWLPDHSAETYAYAKNGSYLPDSVEGFYVSPWDLGYGHMIDFDHDFIGKSALQNLQDTAHGQKVWLQWHLEDVQRLLAGSEIGHPEQLRPLDPFKATFQYHDAVQARGKHIGVTHVHGYTVNVGWTSVACVDRASAQDGAEVEILWGDHDGGAANPFIPDHQMTSIRATIRLESPSPR